MRPRPTIIAEAAIDPGYARMKSALQPVSTAAQKAVLYTIMAYEGYRIMLSQIALMTGMSTRNVGHVVSLLIDQGLIRRDLASPSDCRLPHNKGHIAYCYIVEWRALDAMPRLDLAVGHYVASSRRRVQKPADAVLAEMGGKQ